MTSILSRGTSGRPFRTRWRGYDRAEVDEALGRIASERQQLEELTALRAAIADQLYTSVSALRKATDLLSTMAPASVEERGVQPVVSRAPAASTAPQQTGFNGEQVAPSSGRKRLVPTLAFGMGLAAAVVFLLMREPSATEIPTAPVAIGATQSVPAPAAGTSTKLSTEPVRVEQSNGVVLTLTALDTCWVRAGIDGDEPFERLLRSDDTLTLRAVDEVVLRVGDAAALSLLINGRSAKPLGAVGQVVTLRITPADYATLLADSTDLVTNRRAIRSEG